MDNSFIKSNNTLLGKIISIDTFWSHVLVKTFIIILQLASLFGLLHLIINFSRPFFPDLLAVSYFLLAIALAIIPFKIYLEKKLKLGIKTLKDFKVKIAAGEKANYFDIFSLDLAKSTRKVFSSDKNSTTANELATAILKSKQINFILLRIGVSNRELHDFLAEYKSDQGAKEVIAEAANIAQKNGHQNIWTGDVFLALCQNNQIYSSLIQALRLEISDIENIVHWQTKIINDKNSKNEFLNTSGFKLTGGIGKEWIYGYSNMLRRYSINITESIKTYGSNLEIVGREAEIKEIERALMGGNGGNVVVVGDVGIGKRTTILGFAKRLVNGDANPALLHSHIFQLDLESILSSYSGAAELTRRFNQILGEAVSAGNTILFIENINNILSTGSAGKADVSEVLISYMGSSSLRIIGTCDVASYNGIILGRSALAQKFTRVSIKEPDDSEMIKILENTVPIIEYQTGSLITYEAIKETLSAANKYILNLPNPEKSINLLEGTVAKATADRGQTLILAKDINDYIAEKIGIPITEVGDEEKNKLLDLEKEIHHSVIGQDEAVKSVTTALMRSRANITDSKKPIGSFLFLGPTGVGKTATAKALARSYFGGEDKMIRFDMSEYQNGEDIYRLIGRNSVHGTTPGNLTTFVSEKPFSLVLFDEIEKADPDILNLFLQIFDEGILTDGEGRKVSFSNTIIIATSNAGADLIREAIKNGMDYQKTKVDLIEYLHQKNIFKPELINRFTAVVAFSPLSLGEIGQVARITINKIKKDLKKNKDITLEITDEVINNLAQLGYDPKMGARLMERTIQEKLENMLAEKILKGELNEGESITVQSL